MLLTRQSKLPHHLEGTKKIADIPHHKTNFISVHVDNKTQAGNMNNSAILEYNNQENYLTMEMRSWRSEAVQCSLRFTSSEILILRLEEWN